MSRRREERERGTDCFSTPLQAEQFDLLHSGVGAQEAEIYRNLFGRLKVCLEKSAS